jgi:hypothetical protein
MTDAIRAKYEQVAIPPIMPSQFVCPGGFNFAKYMLKLSMLVMYQHLKKDVATAKSKLLSSIRPHINPIVTNAIMSNVKLKTDAVEARVKETWQNFQEKLVAATVRAGSLVENVTRVERELRDLDVELTELKMESNQTRRVDSRLDGLKEEMAHLEGIKNLCNMCRESLKFLNNDPQEIKFNKDESIPKSFGCLNVVDGEELNLHNFFNGLTVLLASGDFDESTASSNQLNDVIKFVSELTEKYNKLINN